MTTPNTPPTESTSTAMVPANTHAPANTNAFTSGHLSLRDIIQQQKKIAMLMKKAMREDVHYGKIPGCGDKPTLLKPGAELIAMFLGLAPRFRETIVELPDGHREVRVSCRLVHIATGTELGDGLGSCSTMESKYRWRNASRSCPECKKETVRKSKDDSSDAGGYYCWAKLGGCGKKWSRGNAQAIESQELGKVENRDIADTYNTVLKMAVKRAQVAATLTIGGASFIFTQDIEDMPDVVRGDRRKRDADDAEFTDRPEHTSSIEPHRPTTQVATPGEAEIDPIFKSACDNAKTSTELRDVCGPMFNSMQKGTPERAAAYDYYTRRLVELKTLQAKAS